MNDVGPEGLLYYKGTCCPILPSGDVGLKATAYGVLLAMLRDGLNIEDTGDCLIVQMDEIEETLRLADGGQTTGPQRCPMCDRQVFWEHKKPVCLDGHMVHQCEHIVEDQSTRR